jgi:hypothetical protein
MKIYSIINLIIFITNHNFKSGCNSRLSVPTTPCPVPRVIETGARPCHPASPVPVAPRHLWHPAALAPALPRGAPSLPHPHSPHHAYLPPRPFSICNIYNTPLNTCLYSYCNICNIYMNICNIKIKHLKHTSKTVETYICLQHNIISMLGRVEACWHAELLAVAGKWSLAGVAATHRDRCARRWHTELLPSPVCWSVCRGGRERRHAHGARR